MKKISIYVRSEGVSPSGYYRILQYTQNLEGTYYVHNMLPPLYYKWYLSVKDHIWIHCLLKVVTYIFMYIRCIFFVLSDCVNKINIVIISRGLLPKIFLFPVPLLLKQLISNSEKLIWDVDDDIMLSNEISKSEYFFLAEYSTFIFVTHSYLAEKISTTKKEKIIILPTTDGDFSDLKLESLLYSREESFKKKLILVWTGSAVNLVNLEVILPILDVCAKKFENLYGRTLELNVCCSKPLVSFTKYLIVNNVLWNKKTSVNLIKYSHIGIMPLCPSLYSLGKGGFKLIQYMAAGLPIIGSNVGYNVTIINNKNGRLIHDIENIEEWMDSLLVLGSDFKVYRDFAINSLNDWNCNYSAIHNLSVWSKYLNVSLK